MHEPIADKIEWVGVVDWELRRFHGHELSTHRGSTYNAYLIRDEKTVLVDTVWGPFAGEFIEKLASIVDPEDIDVVVANHAETDHSGALPEVMRVAKNAQLVVSKKGVESIEGHYHGGWDYRAVGTGDRIDIGSRELVFFEAPMLHWPDSMFTYVTKSNALLPNDAFGQHYATAFRFNDQVNREELFEEALKYYVNILTPFSHQVLRKIDELLALKLPVDVIASSHGVIWRKDPMQIVEKYREWARQKPTKRAVILYDTMWHGTRKMAEAIGDGLAEKGIPHKILHMAVTDRNDALVEVHQSGAVIVGSPTLNNGMLPSLLPVLGEMKGLRFQNKIGAAFGSYGWSGQSVKLLEEYLTSSGVKLIREGIRFKWQPKPEELDECRAFGREIAEAVKKL